MNHMVEPFMNTEQSAANAPVQPTAQIISLEELQADPAAVRASAPFIVHQANPLHAVKVSLQACVGEAQLTVGELLEARENQVIQLNCGIEQPVDLLLEGKVVARGQLVAIDGCFAVRITELPVPLKV